MRKKEYVLTKKPIKVNEKIREVLDIYSRLHVPRKALMEDYLAVITTNNLEEAANPWIYVQKGIKKQEVEQGVSALETAFIMGAMKLAREKPTDVIRASFYVGRNESALECCVLVKEYLEMLSDKEDALVINPSPDMVIMIEKIKKEGGENCYVVTDKTIAKLYKQEFPNARFLAVGEEIKQKYTSLLICGRDYQIDKINELMQYIKSCCKNVLAVVPNAYLENGKYGAEALLAQNDVQINEAIILDSGVTVAAKYSAAGTSIYSYEGNTYALTMIRR